MAQRRRRWPPSTPTRSASLRTRPARRASTPTMRTPICSARAAAAAASAGIVALSTDEPATSARAHAAHRHGERRSSSRCPPGTRTSRCTSPGRHMAEQRAGGRERVAHVGASAGHGDRRAAWRRSGPVARAARRRRRRSADVTVIDDTYNANPDSGARGSRRASRARRAPRWLVLGDMGEVGEAGPPFHRRNRRRTRSESGVERLLAVGVAFARCRACVRRGRRALRDRSTRARASASQQTMHAQASRVLVKGSRFMRMERVVAALTGRGPRRCPLMLLWLAELLSRDVRAFNVFSYHHAARGAR